MGHGTGEAKGKQEAALAANKETLTAGISIRVGGQPVFAVGDFTNPTEKHNHVESKLLLQIEEHLLHELTGGTTFDSAPVKIVLFCTSSPCKECTSKLVVFTLKWVKLFRDRPFRVKSVFRDFWAGDTFAGAGRPTAWPTTIAASEAYRAAKLACGFGFLSQDVDAEVRQKFGNAALAASSSAAAASSSAATAASSSAPLSSTSLVSIAVRGLPMPPDSLRQVSGASSSASTGSDASPNIYLAAAKKNAEERVRAESKALADIETRATFARMLESKGETAGLEASSTVRHKSFHCLVIKQQGRDSESLSTFKVD